MKEDSAVQVDTANEIVDTSEMDGKYLTFYTDNQLYGVPIVDVLQIVQIQPITSIPEIPSYAKGIISLRGSIIPVIDIRARLDKEEVAYDDHTCIIIAMIREKVTGFIVDGVDEVSDIPDEEISPPPKMSSYDSACACLTGIGNHGDKVILLVDTKKLLNQDIPGDYDDSLPL